MNLAAADKTACLAIQLVTTASVPTVDIVQTATDLGVLDGQVS